MDGTQQLFNQTMQLQISRLLIVISRRITKADNLQRVILMERMRSVETQHDLALHRRRSMQGDLILPHTSTILPCTWRVPAVARASRNEVRIDNWRYKVATQRTMLC